MRITAMVVGLTLLASGGAWAHEHGRVASAPFLWSVERSTPFGIRLYAGYEYENYDTALNKEYEGDGKLTVVRDLRYRRTTHRLHLGMEAGFQGFTFFLQAPIVLSQQGEYVFQDGRLYPGYEGYQDCLDTYPDEPWRCFPDGVNATNSRTVQEGIASGLGFSDDPAPGEPGRRLLFRGPKRHGIDQIFLGLKFQVPGFNQYADPSKPDWTVTLRFGLPAPGSKVMDFKRDKHGAEVCPDGTTCSDPTTQRPELNTGVGRGVYDFTFATTLAKSRGMTNSFFTLYVTYPFAYTSDSLYSKDYDFSADWGMNPPRAPVRAGMRFGTDVSLYRDDETKILVNAFLGGRMDVVFEGRDYSEAYELLAGSPALNFSCDSENETASLSHLCEGDTRLIRYYPGMTTVENHAILGASVGLNVWVSDHFYVQAIYSARHITEHFVTGEDAGEDDPETPGGTPGLVDLNTHEMNPYYRPIIDQVGHRYRVQEGLAQSFFVSMSVYY